MRILTFYEAFQVQFGKSSSQMTVSFRPNTPYVFGLPQEHAIRDNERFKANIMRTARAESRLKNFHVDCAQSSRTKNVLIYNGSGGFGDQLMTIPLTLILTNMGWNTHVLVDPGNEACWNNIPWVKSIQYCPIELSSLNLFEHTALFDTVCNADELPDQDHPLDRMLHKIGIDPKTVDPKLKNVRPYLSTQEMDHAAQFDRVGLIQFASAAALRSVSPGTIISAAITAANDHPGIKWLLLHDYCHAEVVKKYVSSLGTMPANLELYTAKNIRHLWSLAEKAAVVVAPDSLMIHLAGSFGTPCVGLWGPTSPSSRVAYYANHRPIWKSSTCHLAPCFSCSQDFPRFCPSPGHCGVLGSITVEDIRRAIKNVLG